MRGEGCAALDYCVALCYNISETLKGMNDAEIDARKF